MALHLIEEFEDINLSTNCKIKLLELKTSDFRLIRDFWIDHYADSELYNKINQIISLTSQKNSIFNKFQDLINTDLVAFTCEFKEVKQTYITYWLNFIFNVVAELKKNKKINNFNEKFKFGFTPHPCFKISKNEKKFKLDKWHDLRNYLIHSFRKEGMNWNLFGFESNKVHFTIKLKDKVTKEIYSLIFEWRCFTEFRNYFLECVKQAIESKIQ